MKAGEYELKDKWEKYSVGNACFQSIISCDLVWSHTCQSKNPIHFALTEFLLMHNGCNSNRQTWCEKELQIDQEALQDRRGKRKWHAGGNVRMRSEWQRTEEEWKKMESTWGEKKEKSTEAGKAPQTGDKQYRVAVPQHKHMTTHTRSVSDSTQTNKHQAFQLCMLCSLLPLTLIYTHSLLFHSLSGIHAYSFSHSQFHCADTLGAMPYTACSVELSHKDRTYSK